MKSICCKMMAKESLFLCLCQQKSLIFVFFCCCFKLDLPSFWGKMTSFDQKMLTQQGLVTWLRKSRDQRVAVSRKHGAGVAAVKQNQRRQHPIFFTWRWQGVKWLLVTSGDLIHEGRIESVLQHADFFWGLKVSCNRHKITRYYSL